MYIEYRRLLIKRAPGKLKPKYIFQIGNNLIEIWKKRGFKEDYAFFDMNLQDELLRAGPYGFYFVEAGK